MKMANKFNEDTGLDNQELAKQLRKPEGESGKQVGEQMNKGNKHICLNSYQLLKPKANEHILEIGMGNGFFIQDLFQMAENLTYTGIDFSPTMIVEATALNQDKVTSGQVTFTQASIEKLPVEDNQIDAITTTNTVYFWPEAKENAKELYRILKSGGRVLIAYRDKGCMDKIKLTEFGFNKYSINEVEQFLVTAGFMDVKTEKVVEPALDFDGEALKMEGYFTTGTKA